MKDYIYAAAHTVIGSNNLYAIRNEFKLEHNKIFKIDITCSSDKYDSKYTESCSFEADEICTNFGTEITEDVCGADIKLFIVYDVNSDTYVLYGTVGAPLGVLFNLEIKIY